MPKAIASLGLVETCRKRRVWGALSAGRCTSRRLESLQIVSKTVLWQFIDVYSTFRSHFSVLPFSCLLFVCAVSSQSFCRFSRLEATWNKIRAQRSWRMWVSLMMEPQCRTGEQSRMLNIVGTSCDKFILDSGGLTVYFLFGRMKASWKWILKPRACLTSEDMTPKLTTPLAIPWKVGLKEELVILFNAHLVNKEHLYSIDWNLRHCEALAIHWSSGATRIQGLYSWCHCVMDPWQPQKPILHGFHGFLGWLELGCRKGCQNGSGSASQWHYQNCQPQPQSASVALSYTCLPWLNWLNGLNQ